MSRDHVAIAHRYAEDVVAGRVLACHWVRRACARHLADMERQDTEVFPYRFDPKLGRKVCRFIELLPHVKGKWAARGATIVLEPWQCFVEVVLYGWVRVDTGKRRFRKAYISVPRKNAKSTLAAGNGLYMLAADGEYGAEVYSGATTEKQAWEVFRPARQMTLGTDEFRHAFGVEVAAKSLYIPHNGSRFEPLIGKPGDGSSPHCAIVDEYHEHDTDEQVDTMVTGMGAREQPLLFVITTSGTNLEGPCFAMESDAKKVLDGVAEDESLFAIVYTVDAEDDWTSEEALRKANPNYDISVSGEFLRGQIADALRSPRKQNIVKTKHLDVWCNARDAWMNLEAWHRCADAPPQTEFAGEPAWGAFDLSSKLDLTAKATVHTRVLGGVTHYYGYVRSYLPEDTAADPTKQHYAEWMHAGHLVATPGNVVDYRVIGDDVREDARAFRLQAFAYDPWNAQQTATELAEDGIPMVEVPQRVSHLSEPMKELEALVVSGRFHHDGNPLLTWAVSNVVSREDPNGNVFPRKERPEGKIDPAVALINAVGRAIAAPGETQSVYETRGVLAFG